MFFTTDYHEMSTFILTFWLVRKGMMNHNLTIYLFDIEYKISSYLVAIFISLNDSKV